MTTGAIFRPTPIVPFTDNGVELQDTGEVLEFIDPHILGGRWYIGGDEVIAFYEGFVAIAVDYDSNNLIVNRLIQRKVTRV
jgi:hypothetical protein